MRLVCVPLGYLSLTVAHYHVSSRCLLIGDRDPPLVTYDVGLSNTLYLTYLGLVELLLVGI